MGHKATSIRINKYISLSYNADKIGANIGHMWCWVRNDNCHNFLDDNWNEQTVNS